MTLLLALGTGCHESIHALQHSVLDLPISHADLRCSLPHSAPRSLTRHVAPTHHTPQA
jgi:hypothetical protein